MKRFSLRSRESVSSLGLLMISCRSVASVRKFSTPTSTCLIGYIWINFLLRRRTQVLRKAAGLPILQQLFVEKSNKFN